jgi:hypothetical protein
MASLVADLSTEAGASVVMINPKTAGREEEEAFARAIGLDESRRVSVDMGTLRIRNVPTFVVVDRAGTILLAREGVLTDADRRDVVGASASASASD